MISYSLVSQAHPVFLGYHLEITEVSWALEEIAYGDETNSITGVVRAILRDFWRQIGNPSIRDSSSIVDFVLRLCGDGPEQAQGRKPDYSLVGWVKMGILVLSQRGCFYITCSDCLMPYSCWHKFFIGHVVNSFPWEMWSRKSDLPLHFHRDLFSH